jgi:subtilisin family serine protease
MAGALVLTFGLVPAASANETAVLDPGTASAMCEAFFDVDPGPEPLSACQWDMRTIEAGEASRALATGDGVTVGIIDGGVDMTHPDLAPNLDVGLRARSSIAIPRPRIRPRSPTVTARTRRPCRISRATGRTLPRPSPAPSTASASSAWRRTPRSSA